MEFTFELDLFDMRKDYSSVGFEESSLKSNPFDQFQVWFNEAKVIDEFEPNSMAIATAGSDGKISQRMVLLKQINTEGFIFFTNYLSKKGVQISQNNYVALLFFWPKSMRQVRIEGIANKISPEDSTKYFNSRPIESRATAFLSKQSRYLPDKGEFDRHIEKIVSSAENIERPVYWGGYIVKPTLFEFWQGGKGRSHDRFEYYKEGSGWKTKRLYP